MTTPTKLKDIKRNWHFIDLKDKILGRIAVEIARKLQGKTKPYFVNNLDCGDFVVLINAKNIQVTGKKATQKLYTAYSGYPGGLKKKNFTQLVSENPVRIINHAVSGMLPNNKIRPLLLKRLFIFASGEHPYKSKFEKI